MGRVVFFIIVVFVLVGCSTKQAVLPQVSNHTETRTELVSTHDTLIQRDSVIIIQRGDTIYHIEKHMIYNPTVRYIERTDTVIHRDTISVPVYIEKKNTWNSLWSAAKNYALGFLGCILVLIALIVYFKLK